MLISGENAPIKIYTKNIVSLETQNSQRIHNKSLNNITTIMINTSIKYKDS